MNAQKTTTLYEVHDDDDIVLITDDYFEARVRFANGCGSMKLVERDYTPATESRTIKEA